MLLFEGDAIGAALFPAGAAEGGVALDDMALTAERANVAFSWLEGIGNPRLLGWGFRISINGFLAGGLGLGG